MMKKTVLLALVAPLTVAGCVTNTAYTGGAPKQIAAPYDTGPGDRAALRDGQAAVAVLPDGCEAWIVDEGVEGYAGDRSDPKSGLPRCTNELPRGAVIGDHRSSNDFPDFFPG